MKEELLLESGTLKDSITQKELPKEGSKTPNDFVANNFYITLPWSPQVIKFQILFYRNDKIKCSIKCTKVYFSVRGSENFHIYLWIAKDLSWSQGLYWPSMIFGSAALAWCLVLAYHAISARCVEEVYMLIALVLWLAGNFVWMAGKIIRYCI